MNQNAHARPPARAICGPCKGHGVIWRPAGRIEVRCDVCDGVGAVVERDGRLVPARDTVAS